MNFKKIGIDANVPLNADGSISPRVKNPSIIADTGANWVRVNFILGPWTSPTDSGWIHAYDRIIGGLVDKGLKVYGPIGCEAVHDPPGDLFRYGKSATPAETAQAAHAWIDQYVENFAAIVERFRAKVQVYESFNEPDDWYGWQPKPDLPNPAWIHPYWFATMLERIFQEVKRKRGYDDITLVSGSLQGLEINNNESPKRYLDQIYHIGKTIFGWQSGSYPFDGVGYHLYVKEGFEEDWAEAEKAIQETYKTYLDGIWGVIVKHEGEETNRKLYVSEFGWRSIDGSLMEHEELQAKKLETAIRLLRADSRVGVAIWFCLQDFNVPYKSYGLYKSTGLRPEDRKRPAYNALKRLCPKWPLLGKGFWIWKLDKCEGGDVKAIVEKAKSAALAHVLVKIADGSRPYNGDLAPLVDALHTAGIGVWGWQYTYGTDPGPKEEAEAAVSRVRQFGLDGFAIDAEVEYKGHPERAREYVNALRAGLPDVPIALSSFYLPDYHPDFPWQEFLVKCDLNMPQIYWFSRDPVEALKKSLAQHGKFGKPIFPTGAAYRMTDTSATPSQIQSFLEAVESEGLIGVNFWSWQHATSEMWDVIKEFDWPKEGAQPCIPPSEEISQLREQLEATKAELDAARETIAQLQDQLNVKSSELEDLRRSCAELEAKSNETISQLREQLEASKAELEAARETIGKLQTKLAKLGWLANLGRLFRRGGGD